MSILKNLPAQLTGVSILVLTASPLYARQWTTVNGQMFEAEFVRRDGTNAVFSANGKEYQYPMTSLSVPDRLFINRTVYSQSRSGTPAAGSTDSLPVTPAPKSSAQPVAASPESAAQFQLAGQSLTTSKAIEIEIPITDGPALKTLQDVYGKPSTKAKMLVGLPNGFDSESKSCPLLIVSATTDGAGSSIGSCKANYLPDAVNAGYVVIAVDGEFGRPSNDSTDFRWALTGSALDLINKEWPKSKSWPVATAGISGGGGYASHQAMMLIQKQVQVTGLLLAVTGWDPTDFPDALQRTPFAPLHNMPIFISAGETDTTATKEKTDKMHNDVTRQGFRKVRFEHFPGGHRLHREHLRDALAWFREENEKGTGKK